MNDSLLIAIVVILTIGFVGVLRLLADIRVALAASCCDLRKLADEIVIEEDEL